MINIIIHFYSIDIILNFWKPAFGSYPPLKINNNNNIEKKKKQLTETSQLTLKLLLNVNKHQIKNNIHIYI